MNKSVEKVADAESGKHLNLQTLHIRLRVVEVVLLISLFLSLLHWFVAGANDKKIEHRVDNVAQETGVQR